MTLRIEQEVARCHDELAGVDAVEDLDALVRARKLLPDLPRRNLDTVSYHFGIEIEGRHRATGDAVAAAKCLGKLLKLAEHNGARALNDL